MACAINCAASPACSSSVCAGLGGDSDLTAYRDLDSAFIESASNPSPAVTLELHDEIADSRRDDRRHRRRTGPGTSSSPAIRSAIPALPSFSLRPATIQKDCSSEASFSHRYAASARFRRRREGPSGIGSIVEEIAPPIALHIIAIGRLRNRSEADSRTTSLADSPKGIPNSTPFEPLKRYLAREVFTLITQRRKEINATRIAA